MHLPKKIRQMSRPPWSIFFVSATCPHKRLSKQSLSSTSQAICIDTRCHLYNSLHRDAASMCIQVMSFDLWSTHRLAPHNDVPLSTRNTRYSWSPNRTVYCWSCVDEADVYPHRYRPTTRYLFIEQADETPLSPIPFVARQT